MKQFLYLAAFLGAFSIASGAAAEGRVTITPPPGEPGPAGAADATADADDEDRHAGYYYPAPRSEETYVARAKALPSASRTVRIAFVTGLEVEIAKLGNPIPYAVFAKGTDAEKLIIVALQNGPMDTLYRARGVLANLTAKARLTPLLRDSGAQDWFTFFDMLAMIGFEQLTVSDGKSWAHQIHFE